MTTALLDGVRTVQYDTGDGVIEAIVLNEIDVHTLKLAHFHNGVLTLINDGNPVPERAEGGGVTWTD